MAGPRIGSLFSGTGALDLAVMDVFGGQVVWHSQYEPPDKNGREDKNQYAAKILARHWPDVPNLGDVTVIDWQAVTDAHGPVDILTGGFPCTDVSSAGKRAGLTPETRSGLWNHMAHAIAVLQPRLVIIENVEGLLSAPADRGLGLDAEALEEEARAGRVLRALGAVLGDLATLGFDAEWEVVAASHVGAPHQRKRVIIYAWPAAADSAGFGHGDARPSGERGISAAPLAGADPAGGGAAPADADEFGRRADVLQLRPGQPDLDWGDYGPAIRRWEAVLGRPAPWPTDALGRLSPVFTEWLMGLPNGWVTCTPGLTRSAMLRALGNGVVWLQASAAIRLLHQRAVVEDSNTASYAA